MWSTSSHCTPEDGPRTGFETLGLKTSFRVQRVFISLSNMVPGLQLFSDIGRAYGVGVLNKIRKWEDKEIKRCVIREQLRYCTLCRNWDVLPVFARVKPPVNSKGAKEVAWACGRRLLKCAMDDHHKNIHRLGRDLDSLRNHCEGILEAAVFNAVRDKISNISRAKADSKRLVLDSKFNRLVDTHVRTPQNWVRNLSSRHLNEAEMGVLSKGLNFNVPGGVKRGMLLG